MVQSYLPGITSHNDEEPNPDGSRQSRSRQEGVLFLLAGCSVRCRIARIGGIGESGR